MKRLIRAAVVVAGMIVALPALGGELPLFIVASDFDALLDQAAPAPLPVQAKQTKINPRSAAIEKKPVVVAALPGIALAMRAPRAMK